MAIRNIIFLIFILLSLGSCKTYTPTAKTFLFEYFTYQPQGSVIDSLARKYDLIVLKDRHRSIVPLIRKKAFKLNQKIPLMLIYKDGLTLIGSGSKGKEPGDQTIGGWVTVGGFWHFDSIFRGLGYEADTFFLMTSNDTEHKDKEGRVQAGSADYWKYRWAMDWGKEYWIDFFACTTKVQCLRNFVDTTYDNTYFDGVFIDNVIHFNRQYRMFPKQYWNGAQPRKSDERFQNFRDSFLIDVYAEYHDDNTPIDKPCEILAIGNTNLAFMQDGLWERLLQNLDGGMEEFFAQTWQHWQDFDDWQKMISEIQYAESKDKRCLVRTDLDSYECISKDDPLSVVRFDSTQMMYGFTSYLMGFDSTTYFSFQGDYQHVFWAPLLEIDIGGPVGPFTLREDSLAYRHFEKGIVYCNPTASSKSIKISKEKYILITPAGDTLSVNKLMLKPYNGAIFRKREK